MSVYEVEIQITNTITGRVEADSRQEATEAAKTGQGTKIKEDLPVIQVKSLRKVMDE